MNAVLVALLLFTNAFASPSVTETVARRYFMCNGAYRSLSCTARLPFHKCEHGIELRWAPLRMPGSKEWAKNRNWCTIVFDGNKFHREKKFEPKTCDKVGQLIQQAMSGFPELKWQDASCSHHGDGTGWLYVSHEKDRLLEKLESESLAATGSVFTKQKTQVAVPPPAAVLLSDFNACTFFDQNKKKLMVRCPVLPQTEHVWLRKFLSELGIALVIQNPLK